MPSERVRSPLRRWLWRLVVTAAAIVVGYLVIERIGRIDWDAVGDALGRLSWWQPFVLLVVVAVRQVLNACPLHYYIAGLSLARATQNDLGAILMYTFAPGPANYGLRMAMFSSWDIPLARGAAGALMNTLTFWMVRFSAPLAGFAMIVVVGGEMSFRWADLVSLAVAVGIVVGVMLVLRSDALARLVGLRSGRLIRRVRSSVDPERWARSCVDFRSHVSHRFRYGFPRSLAATVLMVAVEWLLLVLCLRFVGVSSSDASLADIAIAYLFAFPLTAMPFSGIGVLDSLVIASLVQTGDISVEAPAFAGLVVWRIFTLGVPAVGGAVAVALWRHTSGWTLRSVWESRKTRS
ncbi:MAG: flippase-like domain-containing protein [Nocardioides sp.]|nr:flippase-like domain-containing protein [Nocardioides sp.]